MQNKLLRTKQMISKWRTWRNLMQQLKRACKHYNRNKVMGGGSGASTPTATVQDSQQVYTPWFNDLQQNLGSIINQQANRIPALTNQIQGGGTPTTGSQNIWNQPSPPQVPQVPSGVVPMGHGVTQGALAQPAKA